MINLVVVESLELFEPLLELLFERSFASSFDLFGEQNTGIGVFSYSFTIIIASDASGVLFCKVLSPKGISSGPDEFETECHISHR